MNLADPHRDRMTNEERLQLQLLRHVPLHPVQPAVGGEKYYPDDSNASQGRRVP